MNDLQKILERLNSIDDHLKRLTEMNRQSLDESMRVHQENVAIRARLDKLEAHMTLNGAGEP